MKRNPKLRSILVLALVLLVMLPLLSGCATSASASNRQTYAWPVATGSPEDTVTHLLAVKFAEEVGSISNGRIRIQVYGNSNLGNDVELLESCASGDIPFIVQTTAPQVDFVPDVAVFDLPCAFATLDELREAVSAENFRDTINKSYIAGGYRLLAMADQGFREMTTNKSIQSINDFKGQKIRTMENKYHIAFWKAIGANPTPMNFGEVYIGLQQGTIDAQENPYEAVVSGKLYEQQDYLVQTRHVPHLLTLIVSNDFYDALSQEDKDIIDEAARRAQAYAWVQTDERSADRVQIIVDSGTKIVEISPELREEIMQASQPVYDMIREQVGDELVDILLSANSPDSSPQ